MNTSLFEKSTHTGGMEEEKPGETHVALEIQISGVGRNGQMLVNVLEPGRC